MAWITSDTHIGGRDFLLCTMVQCSFLRYSFSNDGYKSVICSTNFQGVGYSLRDHKCSLPTQQHTLEMTCCYTCIPRIAIKFLFTWWHSFTQSQYTFFQHQSSKGFGNVRS